MSDAARILVKQIEDLQAELERERKITSRIRLLALEIADEGSIEDLEMLCLFHKEGDVLWYDVTSCDALGHQCISRAVEYLTLRELLIIHPENRTWVRVDKEAQS